MFEDYLQDSNEFLAKATTHSGRSEDREARRYYRASAFYTAGAIEAFVNYVADGIADTNLPPHEICFLNDKTLVFSVSRGVTERTQYHSVDDKIRVLTKRFAPDFDFEGATWTMFMEFRRFRDSLVHPREEEDKRDLAEYHRRAASGLQTTIEVMNQLSRHIFRKPLRKQLLDLAPD